MYTESTPFWFYRRENIIYVYDGFSINAQQCNFDRNLTYTLLNTHPRANVRIQNLLVRQCFFFGRIGFNKNQITTLIHSQVFISKGPGPVTCTTTTAMPTPYCPVVQRTRSGTSLFILYGFLLTVV